jgi:hypothetical protein
MATLYEPAVVNHEPDLPDERPERLDRELARLPAMYRAAIVLCELQGLTHQEAARRLGCPVGTLSARLSRGRALLTRRLAGRGVATPGGGLGLLLAGDAASASLPASLAGPTARGAALFIGGEAVTPGLISPRAIALAEGVIKTMLLAKLKLVMTIVASVAVLGSATALMANPGSTRSHAVARLETRRQQDAKAETKPAQQPDKQGPILTGRVVDEAGRPLPGVRIILYNGLCSRWKGQEATTDQDGRYRFDPLRTGAMIEDGPSGRWDWRPGMRLEHPTHASADGKSWWDIRVPGIDRKEHVQDFEMVPGGRLAGRVLDPKTKAPLKRLGLNIGSPTGRNPRFHVYARTDDGGRFISEPLFPGEYVVDVNSAELGMPVLGKVQIEAKKTLEMEFSQDKLRWAIAEGVTARNGGSRLEALRAFTVTTGETHGDGRTSTTKHFILPPDRYRCETRFDGDDKTLVCIFAADVMKRWYKQDDGNIREVDLGGLGLLIDPSPAYWRDFIKLFGPRAVLRLRDPEYRLTLLDDAMVGGKAVFGIGLTKRVHRLAMDLRMFFDLDTGLLLRQENVREGSETNFYDFKEFQVIPVARKSITKPDAGKAIVRTELIELKSEDTLADRWFRGP